jgi:broad specificity phosphatase PhoE
MAGACDSSAASVDLSTDALIRGAGGFAMRLITLFVALVLPGLAAAQDWEALRSPTAIVLMRHALAPGTGDPAGFRLDDCATQRNLDARGRAQAERIGAALRNRGIDFDAVWTSQWCRCRETAQLLELGPVIEKPPLNSFFGDRSREDAQTQATRAMLEDASGDRLMLVTHQVNITALTGVFPSSGEIVVAELRDGGLTVTGRIAIDP